jgi:hypothetical protein
MPQWIQNGIKIREASCFTSSAPTLFVQHKPLLLWLFRTLKGVSKDRKCNSSDESEEPITKVWDGLILMKLQGFFHDLMIRFAQDIENGGEYLLE